MNRYTIRFTFIENGHVCKTTWSGCAESRAAAVKKSREWFGFDKDGIEVTNTEVLAGKEDD